MAQQLSKYFTYAEMIRSQVAARCGISNEASGDEVECLTVLCQTVLDPVREHFGIPFSPSSAYRSQELNERIGSKPTSQHCLGQAADIEVPGVANLQLEYYDKADPAGGWIHISTRKSGSEENRREVMTFDGSSYDKGLPG